MSRSRISMPRVQDRLRVQQCPEALGAPMKEVTGPAFAGVALHIGPAFALRPLISDRRALDVPWKRKNRCPSTQELTSLDDLIPRGFPANAMSRG